MTETRSVRTVQLAYRDDAGAPTFTGYASVFSTPYEVRDFLGSYSETIAPGAFARTLASQPDVRLLINHDGLPLARTKSGTLTLTEDAHGLSVRAQLDPSDPDVQSTLPKIRRGDAGEMSFAFTVPKDGDEWTDNYSQRLIREVDLNGGDVSLVTYPANQATTASIRKKTPMNTTTEYRDRSDIDDDLFSQVQEEAQRFAPGAGAGSHVDNAKVAEGIRSYIDRLKQKRDDGLASEKRDAEKSLPVAEFLLRFHQNQGEAETTAVHTRSMFGGIDGSTRGTSAAVTAGGLRSDGSVHQPRAYVGDEQVYRPDGDVSFFRDLYTARQGDYKAAERLERNNEVMDHSRSLSTVAGTGGEFAPPAWLVDQFIALARPGRVAADMTSKDVLPGGVSSLNLPKVSTGTTTGIQQTQNTAVSNTDLVTTSVSSGITTIAGQQVVSLQLLNQSPIKFDEVILGDLALDYAKQLDVQVLTGTGANGQLRGMLSTAAGFTTVTFTSTVPQVVSTTATNALYSQIIKAINAVHVSRFAPPTAILMHPSRWAWILQALDGQQRPLVLSDGDAFNPIGTNGSAVAQGVAGSLANLPVYVDPNIPTNLGVATNQDVVMVARFDDMKLWETPLALRSFEATYANQMSVLFRAHAWSSFIPDRYATSAAIISGTGLTTPNLG